jgi:hypothetical protein
MCDGGGASAASKGLNAECGSRKKAGFGFPFTAKGSFQDEIRIEQAIPLGRLGVLILLYPEDRLLPLGAAAVSNRHKCLLMLVLNSIAGRHSFLLIFG